MEEENKLPLKRVELSLSKFNEVAIPHHLDLLRQHKTNIIKYEESSQYERVRTEQAHARRVASQLRTLLAELESLRRQVRSEDVARFDKLTERSRELTLRSIMDYLGSSPLPTRRAAAAAPSTAPGTAGGDAAGSALSTDSVGVVAHCAESGPPGPPADQIQLQVVDQELELRAREAALRGWAELQAEVRALHEAWQHVQAAALASRGTVGAAQDRVEVAADSVGAARVSLGAAERLAGGALGAGGALAGLLLGGPVGLVAGAKAGALAALLAGGLGYLGGSAVARRRRSQLDAPLAPPKKDA